MDNIIVITQNVKLPSLAKLKDKLIDGDVLVVSTQFIFENEREIINNVLCRQCQYINFADLLSDKERQRCDEEAFDKSIKRVDLYYDRIKVLKNERIVAHLQDKYPCKNCILVSDDLGICREVWGKNGYIYIKCEYYHESSAEISIGRLHRIFNAVISQLKIIKRFYKRNIFKTIFNGQKYLFFGSTNRIGYRMNLDFKTASKIENIKFIIEYYSIILFGIMPKNNTIRMTTLHEDSHWRLPDNKNFNTKKIQDGYLPPNYTSRYLYFFGENTEFYTWDEIGCHTFQNHHLKNAIMPFRKKLFLPKPKFPKIVKKVLCVASGAGDWTAIKNRSDEDMMLMVFGKVAKIFPNIEFVYRCHPVWIHPKHQGVNSINRAAEYLHWLNLPNFRLSGNIPSANNEKGEFILSYNRSSFEEDLNDVDIVFGEHSVSMLDAGFKNIMFASCNVTGHRNFFEDITNLGFPHCESIEEIVRLIKSLPEGHFQKSYNQAIENYNKMTDRE
ncbi:MAG: hypothetical protein IJ220_02860 [Clostridia bacterium]|nr:hypothetical protein [Clostridia bacterium]